MDKIVDITKRCDVRFQKLLDILSDRKDNEYHAILSYQERFKVWANNLAAIRTSQDISTVQSITLSLLELIEENQERGKLANIVALEKNSSMQILILGSMQLLN